RAARANVSLGTVLRRYVAGHGRLGEFISDEAERMELSSDGPALRRLRRAHHELLESLTAAIESEYNQECEQVGGSQGQRRGETVRQLLSGESIEPVALATLAYELHMSWHVGIIAVGLGAHAALGQLKDGSELELLLVPGDAGAVWGWLGARQKVAVEDAERLLSTSLDFDLLLAMGEPGEGVEGWR